MEPNGLTVAHLPHVRERGCHVTAALRLGAELPDDDDLITGCLEELAGLGSELLEILRDGGEYVVCDALRAVEGARGRTSSARLVPFDIGGP